MTELVRASGLPYGTATRRIQKLVDAGLIVKVSAGETGKSYVLAPSATLRASFIGYAQQIKALLAEAVGQRDDTRSDERYYFGDLHSSITELLPPEALRLRQEGATHGLKFLFHDDNYFNSLRDLWTDFRANAGSREDFTLLKLPALYDTLLRNATLPESAFDIVALNFPWLSEFADKELIAPLDEPPYEGLISGHDFHPTVWEAGTWKLHQYGVPLYVTVEGFLDPTSLWVADAAKGDVARVRTLPARFDASTHLVEQFWATSTDGTKIPYFLVRPKTLKRDGSTPTIMYGYGGFEIAKPPVYVPEMGRIWLQRGGAYVIANIRGGGEFGPAWHDAVLREKRQLAFDDFAAVARDLAARGIASARHLGIYGRSNGGVLTTVSMTQHPELWNAVVVESPLVDMLRYNHLSAGASWVGEYGDPDVAADRAFIEKYSGYQNLKAGVKYPEPYITTNTRDDRVHPGHARKFAAKLEAMGIPYLYYEQTFGGHANDADPELNARRWARHYVYLAQKLMD